MNICINQYAFIAAIVCISTALHTKHEPLSTETLRLMLDESSALTDNLTTVQERAKAIEQQYIATTRLDYKDKNITSKRRNKIRELQRKASTARTKIDLQMKNIQRFLKSTINQTNKAKQTSAENIQSIQLATLHLPIN